MLHEISHCLVPQVELKRDGEWVLEDHSRVFYEKFWQVVKEANQQGLYFKCFDNIQHLMRYDKSVWGNLFHKTTFISLFFGYFIELFECERMPYFIKCNFIWWFKYKFNLFYFYLSQKYWGTIWFDFYIF